MTRTRILLPALGKAREIAKATQCLAAERSIGLAMNLYATAYKDIVPREGVELTTQVPPERRREHLPWPVAFRPFLDDNVTPNEDPNDLFVNFPFYRCPSRPIDAHNIHFVINAMPFRSPGVHDPRGIDWRYRKGPSALSRLPRPASTFYITDFFDDDRGLVAREIAGASNDVALAQFYDLWHPQHVLEGGSMDVMLIDRVATRRHGSGANALFLDGHASFVKREDLVKIPTWDDGDYIPQRLHW